MAQHEEHEPEAAASEPQSGELPETHLSREDDRWSRGAQVRDWLVLLLMIAVYLTWAGIVYFLEPGIR
jgi:hypothetical protein